MLQPIEKLLARCSEYSRVGSKYTWY